ncbi:hypothetical protein KY317_01200 [Candidatus Woesearchaeota archaeon]|nr:hypothetical protein [Candidatus Woesearchaeota archaeon]
MALSVEQLILLIIIATLAAIAYSLRVLVMMERRLERMEGHLEKVTARVLSEERKIKRLVRRR